MSRYRFELAGPADDADLRHILAATPMAGRIAVAFRREPSYFAGAPCGGPLPPGRGLPRHGERPARRLRLRSASPRYVNGRPESVGYLSTLRLLAEHRNRGLVARGYAFFRRLHADGQARLYLTTIAEGNTTALTLLTSGRAGLPAYHDAGRYHTAAIPLTRRTNRGGRLPAWRSGRPGVKTWARLLAFLREQGPRRQFFPAYEEEDFVGETGVFKDLQLGRRAAGVSRRRPGRHAGRLGPARLSPDGGAWLRRRPRPGRGRRTTPVARLRGLPPLPPPGGAVRYLTAALPVVAGDDAAVFAALLAELRARAAGGPHDYLMLGLHESDPLLPVVRACPGDVVRHPAVSGMLGRRRADAAGAGRPTALFGAGLSVQGERNMHSDSTPAAVRHQEDARALVRARARGTGGRPAHF